MASLGKEMARRKDGERPCASLTARRSSGFDCNVPFSRRRLPTGMKSLSVQVRPRKTVVYRSLLSLPSTHSHRWSLSIPPTTTTLSTSNSHTPITTSDAGTARCTAVHVPAPPFRTPTPHCLFQSRPYPRYGLPSPRPSPQIFCPYLLEPYHPHESSSCLHCECRVSTQPSASMTIEADRRPPRRPTWL